MCMNHFRYIFFPARIIPINDFGNVLNGLISNIWGEYLVVIVPSVAPLQNSASLVLWYIKQQDWKAILKSFIKREWKTEETLEQ